MALMERLNLSVLGAGLTAIGFYLWQVVPQVRTLSVDEVAWKWPMATAMLIFIIIVVASAVQIVITDPDLREEASVTEDERDRRIEWRADSWGGNTLHLVALGALVMLFLGLDKFWIAQLLFLGGMLASLVTVIAKMLAYQGRV